MSDGFYMQSAKIKPKKYYNTVQFTGLSNSISKSYGADPYHFYIFDPSSHKWEDQYKPPTLEDLKASYVQGGYVEVVPDWWVQNQTGELVHCCNDGMNDCMPLNPEYHHPPIICEECNMPPPDRPFFLSESLKG